MHGQGHNEDRGNKRQGHNVDKVIMRTGSTCRQSRTDDACIDKVIMRTGGTRDKVIM